MKIRRVGAELIHADRQEDVLDIEHFLLPTDAHNVKKRRVIKTF